MIPIHDRVLVERIPTETKTKSGIIIPDIAQEKQSEAIVYSVGSKVKEVKKGDRILFGRWSGAEIKTDDGELLEIKESDILAIIQ